MITFLQEKLKQLFCRHKNTYFKEANALSRRHYKYGCLICKRCGKVVHTITLDNLGDEEKWRATWKT